MKTFACPFCNKKLIRKKLESHIERNHEDELPEIIKEDVQYVANQQNGMRNVRNIIDYVEILNAMKL